ncbi:TIGR04104 family putative zinc finger protein [Macrococcoides canis]|uniref:TIGR04104 family putative zinc finger protein n=1 Tax=Macrococcoides canis TaxID=1855823 RepID=UPI001408A06C|nr:TIGR04104 family putative zinc finger protein [Macrococcus canis]
MNCVHCNHKFSFQERMKAVWKPSMNNEVTCPNCGSKQYISNKSIAKSYGLLLLVELIIVLLAPLFKLSILALIVFMIVAIVLVIILFPLTLKLVSEKDGLLEEQFREMENRQKGRRT